MRQVLSIFLLLIFTTPLWLKTGLVVNWVVNNEYISSQLCEKKYDYLNDCKGVCYVSNQLKQVDQYFQNSQPKSETNTIVITDNLSPYILNAFVKIDSKSDQLSESHPDFLIQPHLTVSGMEVFHPPCKA